MKHVLLALVVTYVMPAYSVLKRLAAGRDEVTTSSLKADGLAAVAPLVARELAPALDSTWSSGPWSLTSSVAIRFPGRCRLELTPTDSTKAVVVASANGRVRTEGPAVEAARVALEEVCAVLAQKSGGEGETRAAIERHLAALKVDTKQVSLGRFEGTVVYVLGDRAEGAPQFQVYKDHFHPARVKLAGTADAPGWDVRFIDYTSQATGDWLPRVVEVWKGKDLYLRLTTLTGDGHAALEAIKF